MSGAALPRPPLVVALDVGGTRIKGALAGAAGELGPVAVRPTGREEGPAAALERVLAFARDLVAEAEAAWGPGAVAGVGVAVPGLVDEGAGVVRAAANLGWQQVPLRDLLADHLGLPVALAHDVRAAALAEGRLGAARGCRDYLFVSLGTGIGAAVVLGGVAYTGAHGSGGEFGHMAVNPAGPRCACGQVGCLEAVAAAPALVRRYRELAAGGAAPTGGGGAAGAAGVAASGDAPHELDARTVVERAAAGDPAARQAWAEAVGALAQALASYVALLDPERVVIGGGMAAAGHRLLAPLRQALAERLRLFPVPDLVPAALGDAAGCHGAALRAWERLAPAAAPAPPAGAPGA